MQVWTIISQIKTYERNVCFEIESNYDQVELNVALQVLQQVIFNLLHNAVKFYYLGV